MQQFITQVLTNSINGHIYTVMPYVYILIVYKCVQAYITPDFMTLLLVGSRFFEQNFSWCCRQALIETVAGLNQV